MNPLTLAKRLQDINAKEAALGISEDASWHAEYKDSPYIYIGGIPHDLTEGDLCAVFAQYGEIVDVNIVKDKGTGKSKGFAFLAYEDQRSTNVAVDNLNNTSILGRTIRVDHVSNYKKKEEADAETEQRKREERGVCRAFQKGECSRGAGCKFSHDEQRAANTGWGHEEDMHSRKAEGRIGASSRNERQSGVPGQKRHGELGSRDTCRKDHEKKRGRSYDIESNSREERDRLDEKRSRKHKSGSYHKADRDSREIRS